MPTHLFISQFFLCGSSIKVSILLVRRSIWRLEAPWDIMIIEAWIASWSALSGKGPQLSIPFWSWQSSCVVLRTSVPWFSKREHHESLLPKRFSFCWKLSLILLEVLKVSKDVLESRQCFIAQEWQEFPCYFTRGKAMGFSRAVASYFILPALSEDSIVLDLKKKNPMTDFTHVF